MHACACRRYIDDDLQARDIDSPFRVDGAIMGLFDALLTLRDEGRNITKLLVSVEMLAQVTPPPRACACHSLARTSGRCFATAASVFVPGRILSLGMRPEFLWL